MITVIGDITLDVVSSMLDNLPKEDTEMFTQFTLKLGGQAAHCALGLAHLGIKTKFFGCLGNDPFGESIIKKLKMQENLQLCLQRKNRTALSFIALTKNKRTIMNDAGANALFEKNIEVNTPYLFIGGVWHLKRLNIVSILKRAKSKNVTTFIDFGWNPKPNYKLLEEIFKYGDFLFLNKKELLKYTKQATIKKIKNNIALHLGTEGSALYSKGKTLKVPISEQYNIDTTGAGDFWNAAFIYGIMKRSSIKSTLRFANRFAITCIRKGLHNL
jgi:ribokinase